MIGPDQNPLVRKLEALYPLTPEDKTFLDGLTSRTVDFRADQDIIQEVDRPAGSNLLLEGLVCRYKILPDGKRQIFSFHCAGDIFDVQSFLLNTMDHSVATLTPCRVALIPHSTILEITETYPRIARALWKDALVDASIFREWMLNIARRQAYPRLAHLICELYTKLSIVGLTQGNQAELPITQNEIADAIGLSLVHVNRTMQELRSNGLIAWSNGVLTILDWDGLKAVSEFDRNYMHLRSDYTDEDISKSTRPLMAATTLM